MGAGKNMNMGLDEGKARKLISEALGKPAQKITRKSSSGSSSSGSSSSASSSKMEGPKDRKTETKKRNKKKSKDSFFKI